MIQPPTRPTNKQFTQTGMALVVVLVLGAVGIMVVSMGVALSSLITQANLRYTRGLQALHIAESGAENALMRILRDPNYSGETLTVGEGTATIGVTGSSPRTITVTGTLGTSVRRLEVQTSDQNGVMTVSSWREVF